MKFFKIVIILFFSLTTYELLAKDHKKTDIKNSKIDKINKLNCDALETSGACSFLKQTRDMFCDENEKNLCTGSFVCNPITWQNSEKDKDSFVFEYFDDKIILKKPPSALHWSYELFDPRPEQWVVGATKKYIDNISGDIIVLQSKKDSFQTIKRIRTLHLTKINFSRIRDLKLTVGKSVCNRLD